MATFAVVPLISTAITCSAYWEAQEESIPDPVPRSKTVPLVFSVMASKNPANLSESDVRLW